MKRLAVIMFALVALGFAAFATAKELSLWSISAASNNSTPPDGFPEGMQRKDFNNAAREIMASVRTWYADPEWLNLASCCTVSRIDASNVQIANASLAAKYPVDRHVLVTGGGDTECNVTAVVYSAPNTVVTVDCTVPVGTNKIYGYIGKTLRTAAFTKTGDITGRIPLNTSSAPLATAAYVNTGTTASTTVPLNTSSAALGTGAYGTTGNTIGNIALHSSTGPLKTGAYLDPPARAYAKRTADSNMGGAIAVITSLSNIAVPGTPDGVKKYRVNAHVGITTLSADNLTLTLKLGAAGTTADATTLTIGESIVSGLTAVNFDVASFEITPAAGNKVSLCFTSGSTQTVNGTTPQFGWLEIVEIQ